MLKNSWYKIELTHEQYSEGIHMAVKRSFENNYHHIGKGVAIFISNVLNDSYNLYISPSDNRYIQAIIEDFKAIPCSPPMEDVHLLTGDSDIKIL